MTLREKIADWIIGGVLADGLKRANQAERMWRSEAYEAMVRCDVAERQARDAMERYYDLQYRLNRIAACETTKANGTVRRMARIARGEVE